MMSLTPAAARQIQDAIEQGEYEGLGLRIAARQGSDGGIEYGMGFDEEREEDAAFIEKGVNLLVGEGSQALLEGTTLDFVEYQPGEFRFIFIPPQVESVAPPPSTCGSGGCNRCGGA